MIYKSRAFRISMAVFVSLLVLTCVFPFILLLSSSFTAEASLVKEGYSFFPKEVSMSAYSYLWSIKGSIIKAYLMSLIITGIGTSINVIITMLFAYALSHKELPGNRVIAFFLFFSMLFNGGFVSTYLIYTQILNVRDSLAGMIVPYLLMNAFHVIIMRTYFTNTIPKEVKESAKIDGAGEFQILVKIIIPMSRPIIATIALLAAIAYWNNWTNGVYFLTTRTDLYGIQNYLNMVLSNISYLQSQQTNAFSGFETEIPNISIRMALAIIAVIPILCAYPFFQKYFVKGITIGSVKG